MVFNFVFRPFIGQFSRIQELNTLLLILFLLINTANQVMFKTVALGPGGGDYLALIGEPLFYLCGLLFVAQAAVWLAVLRRLPLSYAYPFTSLTVITILLSGALFFGESITLGNLVGTLVIMGGVVIIAGGQVGSASPGAVGRS